MAIITAAGYFSRYDPNGLVDGVNGKVYNNTTAWIVGAIGATTASSSDTMPILFTVPESGDYEVRITGTVEGKARSVGADVGIGTHWGDLYGGIIPLIIGDSTVGSTIFYADYVPLYTRQNQPVDVIAPIVWDGFVAVLGDLAVAKEVQDAVEAAKVIKKVYDFLETTDGIVGIPFGTNFGVSTTVPLVAGHQYEAKANINSDVAAATVTALNIGGHFSAMDSVLQITDFSVVSKIPQYALTVASSGAVGVNFSMSPSDLEGRSSGSTPTTLAFRSGVGVFLTAPGTVGTKTFSAWSGVDNQSGNVGFVTMNANRTVTAIYSDTTVTISITSPTSGSTWTTAASKVFLDGLASGLVTNVSWQNVTRGTAGQATGTNAWHTAGISLNQGNNTIVVTAKDSSNQTGTDSIVVNYTNSVKLPPLHVTQDGYITSGSPSKKNYNTGNLSFVGYDPSATIRKERMLVFFDISGIPPGSVVTSAGLSQSMDSAYPSGAPNINITAKRITANWAATTVTWNNINTSFTEQGASSTLVGNNSGWKDWDVTSIVNAWLGSSPNYGIMLISDQESATTLNDRAFDNIYSGSKPVLNIDYVPEVEPPTNTITQPTSDPFYFYTNANNTIPLAGTSHDNYSVATVGWLNQTTGQSGPAWGTTSWSANVPLTNGLNAILVTATDTAGNLGTDAIGVFYSVPDTTAPTVPTAVLATMIHPTQAKVTWNPSTDTGGSGFKEYRLYRNSAFLTSTPFIEFTDAALTASSNYCYTVTAVDNAANESSMSIASCVTTPPLNSTPTDISLSSPNVPENLPSGIMVGAFSTSDPDTGNMFGYSLVTGTGSTDNGSFTISGSSLLTAASFNYENKNSYSIRVRTTDQGGLWFEKAFTVSVVDVAESPLLKFTSIERLPNDSIGLNLECDAGWTYLIQASTNLPSWKSFHLATAVANSLSVTNDNATNAWCFYRAIGFPLTNSVPHPADLDADFSISAGEHAAYTNAFKLAAPWPISPSPIDINYYTKARQIFALGQVYHVDTSTNPPQCWVPGP